MEDEIKARAEHHCTNRFNLENNKGAKSVLRKCLLPDGSGGAGCTNPHTDTSFVPEQKPAAGKPVTAGKFKLTCILNAAETYWEYRATTPHQPPRILNTSYKQDEKFV